MRIGVVLVALLLALAPGARADVAAPGEPAGTVTRNATPELVKELAGSGVDFDPVAAAATKALEEQDERNRQIGVKDGPGIGEMGVATISVPAGYVFAEGAGAKKWAELVGNPISGKEIGLIGPKDRRFLVLFQFDDVGLVKDDDKADLDDDDEAEALLASIQASAVPPMRIVGFEQAPKYNAQTQSLEWCVIAEKDGARISNFHTRFLGRRGVVSATLIFEGDTKLADVLPAFRSLLEGFAWKKGEAYGDHQVGDRIAAYGLRALVVGSGVRLGAESVSGPRLVMILGPIALVLSAGLVIVRARRRR